jgi:Mlc titration factor MtfA (ptsG expression regulator)
MLRSRERRRQQIRERPFSSEWRQFLDETVPLYRRLPSRDREELHGHIQILMTEKRVEGAAGFDPNVEMKLVIFAQAGVLLLHRRTDYFPKLTSILLYPGDYQVQEEVEIEDGLVAEIQEARVGESWSIGTLILSWDEIEQDLEDGLQSVVLHEFTHQLDAESGAMNGAPILATPALRQRWSETMSACFERLAAAADQEAETLLDPYGAEDPAEFFAVTTETFFLAPVSLRRQEPDLYAALSEYFHQDPAQW